MSDLYKKNRQGLPLTDSDIRELFSRNDPLLMKLPDSKALKELTNRLINQAIEQKIIEDKEHLFYLIASRKEEQKKHEMLEELLKAEKNAQQSASDTVETKPSSMPIEYTLVEKAPSLATEEKQQKSILTNAYQLASKTLGDEITLSNGLKLDVPAASDIRPASTEKILTYNPMLAKKVTEDPSITDAFARFNTLAQLEIFSVINHVGAIFKHNHIENPSPSERMELTKVVDQAHQHVKKGNSHLAKELLESNKTALRLLSPQTTENKIKDKEAVAHKPKK